MTVFRGNFIIRTGLGGARSLVQVDTSTGTETTVATVASDLAGDMVLMAVSGCIAVAGGKLTDEATGMVMAGTLDEMVG